MKASLHLALHIGLFALLAALGCGDASSGDSDSNAGTGGADAGSGGTGGTDAGDGGTGAGGIGAGGTGGDPPTGTQIGFEGGEVVSGDGQLTLTIPEGALADPTDIVITELTGDDIPAELQDPTVRKVYDLQPDGLEFALPATVEVRTMGSPAPPEGAPIIGLVSESGGVLELLGPLENTVDDTGIVASAPLSAPDWE